MRLLDGEGLSAPRFLDSRGGLNPPPRPLPGLPPVAMMRSAVLPMNARSTPEREIAPMTAIWLRNGCAVCGIASTGGMRLLSLPGARRAAGRCG